MRPSLKTRDETNWILFSLRLFRREALGVSLLLKRLLIPVNRLCHSLFTFELFIDLLVKKSGLILILMILQTLRIFFNGFPQKTFNALLHLVSLTVWNMAEGD